MIARIRHTPLGRRASAGLLWAGLLLLLASCSQTAAPPPGAPDAFTYVATLPVTTTTDRAAFEADLDGAVLSWQPELGFAIVGLHDAGDLASQETTDGNIDAVSLGFSAWAGGFSAWAGGFSAWAGGVSAWAGGVSAWAGGTTEDNPFPGNEDEWAYLRLFDAQALATNLGSGVKIAVIDTGVDLEHPALRDRLAPAGEWRDYIDGDAYPDEAGSDSDPAFGHGTAVAGVILQVAPNATILPLRVLDSSGYGDLADVALAVDHAIAVGADIINLSLGSQEPLATLEYILTTANSNNVLVVVSGGNSGTEGLTYPAQLATDNGVGSFTLSVGSVLPDDTKSFFSNYGPAMEIHAPGEAITTLYPGDRITQASGTSFAAPWISGGAALILSLPDLKINPASAANKGGIDITDANRSYRHKLGYGRMDLGLLIESFAGDSGGGSSGGGSSGGGGGKRN